MIVTSTEYAERINKEIDWDGLKKPSIYIISLDEQELLQRILTCEVSVMLLSNSNKVDGSNVDTMREMKSELIKKYEELYYDYLKFNER